MAMSMTHSVESILLPRIKHSRLITSFIASLAIAIAAQISIPLQPVPVTLQTLALFFVAFMFGRRVAVTAVAFYLLEGVIGLPVFANFTGGPAVLFGPTAGYLFGFLPAAWVAGWLMEKGWCQHRPLIIATIIISSLCLFIPGTLILSRFVTTSNVWTLGVEPFYAIFVLKLLLLTIFIPKLWRQA